MKMKLSLEPLNNHYRIVIDSENRPVVFESDLPVNTMQQILDALQNRIEDAYDEGWRDGYDTGWDDCLEDDK